ncbi:Dihydrolipoyllysine-residue succinyltransferase component of 2-oxoglutarate dehydrogenase complex [Alphaproteobacteria bacterium SO-S41]|nr:Dihydrolipoyllysine-residue succinyltransferase component of 2-oxoglutarate dehydrogenase complex [Alphaproteobacteria bacterium SO-S41]
MADITVPNMGESVTEATIAKWFKKVGDTVNADEPLAELETDKVTVEVPAPSSGVISSIAVAEGGTVAPGAVIGAIEAGAGTAAAAPKPAPAAEAPKPAPAPEAPKPAAPAAAPASDKPNGPAVERIVAETGVDTSKIPATGKDGRLTKGDVLAALDAVATQVTAGAAAAPAAAAPHVPRPTTEREQRVKMTRLRQTIAKRLKEAQHNAAMLTTFNEVDMTEIMALRKEYQPDFEKRHGVRIGFMSFFVKACVAALKEIPAVNGEIDGDDVIYKNYYDIGVAVGTEKGLVVPVLRDADTKGFADIEKGIADLGAKARDGKLKLEDLQGATFTISNGGVYGSLMSTPILNAPQSGVLGMHKIQDRPIVVNGQIVIRPMMYLALSYDHRLVDGKEAVTFLVRVKEALEHPVRLVLEV